MLGEHQVTVSEAIVAGRGRGQGDRPSLQVVHGRAVRGEERREALFRLDLSGAARRNPALATPGLEPVFIKTRPAV